MTAKRVRRYVPSDESDAALAAARAHLRAEGHGEVNDSHATRWALVRAAKGLPEAQDPDKGKKGKGGSSGKA